MHKALLIVFVLIIFSSVTLAQAQRPDPIPLWPNGAPLTKGSAPADIPSIQIYKAAQNLATGAAVVVCPGGGYGALADHEGYDYAKFLNGIGITVAVLKYRLAPYQHPAPMLDAARAIRYLRSKADELKIDPTRIGIMGSSAGGHLTATLATHFDDGDKNAADPIDRVSSRPDVAILCYPVITMREDFTHKGSRKNLLGTNPDPQLADLMSNEKQVTVKTPPTFIFHTMDDGAVPVENSLLFAEALRKNKVPYEMHIYEHGRHGVGLAPYDNALNTWPKLLENWLRARGFIKQM